MAKYPNLSASADALPLSIFARLYERLATFEGDVIPFQIGDTCLPPPESSRLGALGFRTDHDPDLYAYSKPTGDPVFVAAIVDKLRRFNKLDYIKAENVQLTCGATHALSCAMRAVMDPGDQLLLLTPYWPLVKGIAISLAVRPVETPFSIEVLRGGGDLEAHLEGYITPQTSALYLCNPNNPDGKVLTETELGAIARVARRHGLWVLSDEVYEHFTYDDHQHLSMASLPGMAERTMTCFSFSKSYGQAGLRVGYVVGPREAVEAVRKMANHTVYSVPRAMQRSAYMALTHGDTFLAEARERYLRARDYAFEHIEAPCALPQGGTYLFVDLGQWIGADGECSLSVLERMAEAGLLLAPGAAFGREFGDWARLCFSAVPHETLVEGIERFNRVLGA